MKVRLSQLQSSIISDPFHRLVVTGGAGTGKTTTVVHRLANLVNRDWLKSDRTLVLTRSPNLVRQLNESIHSLLAHDKQRPTVMTWTDWMEKTLIDPSSETALDWVGTTISMDDQRTLIKGLSDRIGIPNKPTSMLYLFRMIQSLRWDLVSPEEYGANPMCDAQLLVIYSGYCAELKRCGLLDFVGILGKVNGMLTHRLASGDLGL